MNHTAVAPSVLKQSGTLLHVMIAWVAVIVAVVEFLMSSLSMEVIKTRHARQYQNSFLMGHATYAILIRAMMLQQSPQKHRHHHLHLNQLLHPPMSRLKSLHPILSQLTAAALSALKQSGILLLAMII